MSTFKPTNQQNPCPVCDNKSGKCRTTSEDLILCMEIEGDVPGFNFIGLTSNGLWSKFLPATGETSAEAQAEHRAKLEQQKQERLALEAERRANSLDAVSLDRHYRQMFDQLGLQPDDRTDLNKRGLTDALIKTWGVRSVEQWQKLKYLELPHTLPGVNLDEKSLNIPDAGYVYPVRNVDGLIVGVQLRLRDAAAGGRYRWLTGATKKRPNGPTPHINGELPLAVHRPATVNRKAIALVEGTGVKPFLLSERLEVVTVGAAGGQFASSPETLKYTLSRLSEDLGTNRVEFFPDAGSLGNKNVLRQYKAAWKLLHQWGYQVEVAWWGQVSKGMPDIDELDDLTAIEFITPGQFLRRGNPLKVLLDSLTRKSNRTRVPVIPREQAQAADVVIYKEGDRLQVWQQAVKDGYRYILDQSGTGTGKSHSAGLVTPTMFGVERVIFASGEHRNPTASTLYEKNGWVPLEGRHNGLIRQTAPDGSTRKRRAQPGDTPDIPKNCGREELARIARDKGLGISPCIGCALIDSCRKGTTSIDFLFQRRETLAKSKFRAHPDSLPSPYGGDRPYDYSRTLILWDEPGQFLKSDESVTVNAQDIKDMMAYLAIHNPELLTKAQPLFTFLLQVFSGESGFKMGKYGLNHGEVMAKLPDLSGLVWDQHTFDLSSLEQELENLSDAEALKKLDALPKRWLVQLIGVIKGYTYGSIRLTSWNLQITVRSDRHSEIAEAAKANVFLDATLSREDLALKLGCNPDEILVVKQEDPDLSNLKIIQVTDLGKMGSQRGNCQQDRAAAVISYYKAIDPNTPVIDFKKFEQDGAWWVDSRGTNCFQNVKRLIIVGTPCRNLSALLAEFSAMTGITDMEDESFKAFVNRCIRADLTQAFGRPRAHRRPGEDIEIILLSDFELDIPTNQVKASEITIEAASKLERVELAIRGAVAQLKEAGQKVTQAAIAALTGYSQQHISRFRDLLISLLDTSNSEMSKNSAPTPELEIQETTAVTALNLVADNENVSSEHIEEVFFNWLTPGSWLRVFEKLTAQAQVQVIQTLIPCLPGEQLEQITALIGGDPVEVPA